MRFFLQIIRSVYCLVSDKNFAAFFAVFLPFFIGFYYKRIFKLFNFFLQKTLKFYEISARSASKSTFF